MDTCFVHFVILLVEHMTNSWPQYITESLALAREEIEGLRSHIEELAIDKAHIQQNYDELSVAVDTRVDQLKVCPPAHTLFCFSFLMELNPSVIGNLYIGDWLFFNDHRNSSEGVGLVSEKFMYPCLSMMICFSGNLSVLHTYGCALHDHASFYIFHFFFTSFPSFPVLY